MKLETLSIANLKIQLGIRKTGSSLWNAAMRELEKRYNEHGQSVLIETIPMLNDEDKK